MVRIAIALGSNLGDRRAHLVSAIGQLNAFVTSLRASSFIDTDPVGVDEPQPAYLNAVAVGETALAPRDLLEQLLAIERAHGRTRPSVRSSRTLDLDLILYGDAVLHEDGLDVPHPRFRERRFVLDPLVEVARDWIDPVTGKTMGALLERLLTS